MKYLSWLHKKNLNNKGFSIAEMIVVVFIAALSILAIWEVYTLYIKISLSNPSFFQASFLAEEGIEAVKFMRDTNWTSNIAPLSPNTSYTFTFDGTSWGVDTTPLLIDNRFDRRLQISPVYRDGSGDIASSGSLDPGTRHVVVTVSWQNGAVTKTRQITTYVSNIFEN